MSQNYGSRHASAAEWSDFNQQVDSISTRIQQMASPMTADQKQRAMRMGDGSVAFVDKAIEIADSNLEMLPRAFDLDEVKRDRYAAAQFRGLRLKLMQMLELCTNAEIAHGSDAMAGGLDIYAFAKSAEGAGVDTMRKLLGKRFERAGHKDVPAPVSA
jgi:hypothetical protein